MYMNNDELHWVEKEGKRHFLIYIILRIFILSRLYEIHFKLR